MYWTGEAEVCATTRSVKKYREGRSRRVGRVGRSGGGREEHDGAALQAAPLYTRETGFRYRVEQEQ